MMGIGHPIGLAIVSLGVYGLMYFVVTSAFRLPEALNDGGSKPTLVPPDDDADRVLALQGTHYVGRAVRTVVIHNDYLILDTACQSPVDTLQQRGDIGGLVEGGNDNGQLYHNGQASD